MKERIQEAIHGHSVPFSVPPPYDQSKATLIAFCRVQNINVDLRLSVANLRQVIRGIESKVGITPSTNHQDTPMTRMPTAGKIHNPPLGAAPEPMATSENPLTPVPVGMETVPAPAPLAFDPSASAPVQPSAEDAAIRHLQGVRNECRRTITYLRTIGDLPPYMDKIDAYINILGG